MARWFTSDTHFGHARILELSGRPFDSIEEHNRELVRRWNERVAPTDEVWHLGDAVMGTFAENVAILGELNGFIRLVPGNHDRVSSVYPHRKPSARDRFAAMYREQGVLIEAEWLQLRIAGHLVNLSHYPYSGDSHEVDRYIDQRLVDDGRTWLIHGHVHEAFHLRARQINVGVDRNDFAPVSERQIAEWMGVRWMAD